MEIPLLFQGEMMTCFNCQRCWKSNKNIESGWTALQADGQLLYICPECWGNNPRFWKGKKSMCKGGKNG